MRKYFVKYGDFSNVYDIRYTVNESEETQAVKQGFERISRKDAEKLCVRESERRKEDPAFSGYAPTVITPFGYDGDWTNDGTMEKIGRSIERKRP